LTRSAGTDPLDQFCRPRQTAGSRWPAKLNASRDLRPQADCDAYPNGHPSGRSRDFDPATGINQDRQLRSIVDDFRLSRSIPLLLAGQVHGRRHAGHRSQALMEQAVYSTSDGQLVTGTFMDYALPGAADGPSFVFETSNVPCKTIRWGSRARRGRRDRLLFRRWSTPSSRGSIANTGIDHIDMPRPPSGSGSRIREAQRAAHALTLQPTFGEYPATGGVRHDDFVSNRRSMNGA